MRVTICSLLFPAALTACASGPARYRSVEGHPLISAARLDADIRPLQLHCPQRGAFYIVPATRPYVAGHHFGVKRPYVRDAALLCERIAAADR